MISPSTGEGHAFTSNSHLIYAAVGKAGGVCICKNVICLLVLGLSMCICVCVYVHFCIFYYSV